MAGGRNKLTHGSAAPSGKSTPGSKTVLVQRIPVSYNREYSRANLKNCKQIPGGSKC